MINPIAPGGLHEFVGENVLTKYACPGTRAIDLGTGHGAMAERLQKMGCQVTAVDLSPDGYEAKAPHVVINFDEGDFAARLGRGEYGVVTAIEVIEHVENPIAFLRNVGELLSVGGVAVLTTPNLDCLPARLRHLFSGKIRLMDERGEPSHVSPIFFDLFQRQYLRLSGMRMKEHVVYPPNGFQASRKWAAWLLRIVAGFFPAESILGDHHVFVLMTKKDSRAQMED
jgi:2-polyprenyl-3-methyl-5-hydroxy-6-metoxy-1,4-benzoquinol methylase